METPAQPQKSFFKRWWFWIIGSIFLIGLFLLGFAAYSGYQNDQKSPEEKAKEAQEKNQKLGFNKRVVKTFTPSSGTAFKYASPLLYSDHIYIGSSERIGYDNAPISKIHDNFFYKFDLDLNVKWQYPLQKKMVAGGAVMDSNHNLYFITELLDDKNNANKKELIFSTTYLTSLTEDGKFRFEKQLSEDMEYWDHAYITPAISKDNIIYFGDSRFYAFDTEGNKLAQYPDENSKKFISYGGSPIIDQSGNVYFTSPEPVLTTSIKVDEKGLNYPKHDVVRAYKFTPKLASVIWSTVMGNEMLDNEGGNPNGGGGQKANGIESPPVFGLGGKVLYGLVGCTISKIDTETGKLLWSLKPDGATGHFNASPAIDAEDNLYVGTKSNIESRFYAISSEGKQLWRNDIGSDLYNSPILGDDNKVYVGSETNPKGKFHAINMKTGKEEWTIGKDSERKIPDFTHDAMLLYKGYVYIGVHSAVEGEEKDAAFVPTFYKIKVDAKNYLPGSPWPRIFGGNSNSGRQLKI